MNKNIFVVFKNIMSICQPSLSKEFKGSQWPLPRTVLDSASKQYGPFVLVPFNKVRFAYNYGVKDMGSKRNPRMTNYVPLPPQGYVNVSDYMHNIAQSDNTPLTPPTDRRVLFVKDDPKYVRGVSSWQRIWNDDSGTGGHDCSAWVGKDDGDFVAIGSVFSRQHCLTRTNYMPHLVNKNILKYSDSRNGIDPAALVKRWDAAGDDINGRNVDMYSNFNSELFHCWWPSVSNNMSSFRWFEIKDASFANLCCRGGDPSAFVCSKSYKAGGVRCHADNMTHCPLALASGKFASDDEKTFCQNFAIQNSGVNFDASVDKFCSVFPNDPFCGCNKNGTVYQALPNTSIADRQVRAFPHCFVPACTDTRAYKKDQDKQTCAPVNICPQSVSALNDGTNSGNKMYQFCGGSPADVKQAVDQIDNNPVDKQVIPSTQAPQPANKQVNPSTQAPQPANKQVNPSTQAPQPANQQVSTPSGEPSSTEDTPTDPASSMSISLPMIFAGFVTIGTIYMSVRSLVSGHYVLGVLFALVTVVSMLAFIATVSQATETFSPVMRYKGAVSVKTPKTCCR